MDNQLPTQSAPPVQESPSQQPQPESISPLPPMDSKTKKTLLLFGLGIFAFGFIIGVVIGGLQHRTSKVSVEPKVTQTLSNAPTPSPTPEAYDPKNAQIVISPTGGPAGTLVHVTMTGIAEDSHAGAGAIFLDSTGARGNLEFDPQLNKNLPSPERPLNGKGEAYIRIPEQVIPEDNDPETEASAEVATALGVGKIVFYNEQNVNIVAEFTVTE